MAGRGRARCTWELNFKEPLPYLGERWAEKGGLGFLSCMESAGGGREVCEAGGVGGEPGRRVQQAQETRCYSCRGAASSRGEPRRGGPVLPVSRRPDLR